MPEIDPMRLLVDTIKEQSAEMKGLRNDVQALSKGLASVETMTEEIKQTRHQLRDELHGLLGKIEVRIHDIEHKQVKPIANEIAEQRGAFRVLAWFAGGGGLSGIVGAILVLVEMLRGAQ